MRRRIGKLGKLRTTATAALLALGAALVAPAAQAAPAQAAPAQAAPAEKAPAAAEDYCQGQCGDILPPGENGNATLVDILGNRAFGTHPEHSTDQLGPYGDL
ncbi:hypothetical protein ACFU99_30180, partial [Streptomyces sp. NPDC057654]|uniref:hypothetical protein n=1 Tax=Streptomyces sp. NPDC057654 TaxID=3346196 RepID=UPI003692F43C